MRLMFLILAHKNAQQCAQLINCLLSWPQAQVTVHVDARAESVFTSLQTEFANQTRVQLLRKRYAVYWGSYNQILATAELIRSVKTRACEYYCLLSGQDFPIKPISEFVNYLEKNRGSEFLEYKQLPAPEWEGEGGLNRVNLYWPSLRHRNAGLRNKLHGAFYHLQIKGGFRRKLHYSYFGGSNWFNLSHKAIQCIWSFLEADSDYLTSFKHTRCADELFVQTILLNSQLKEHVVSDNLRYVDWLSGPDYPRTLTEADYAKLLAAQGKFFARKFDTLADAGIIAKLTQACNEQRAK